MTAKVFECLQLVDKGLRFAFKKLGRQIGLTPGYFIIVPLLLTALAASGFQRITHASDPEYLFSPLDGEAKRERAIVENYFPVNYSRFDPGRVTRGGRFGRLLITASDNETVLRENVFQEIVSLHETVLGVTFVDPESGLEMSYADICATWQGQCWQNDILKPAPYAAQIETGEMKLTYPIWFDPQTFQRVTFPFFSGGIELNEEDHTISSIKVIALNYFLNSATIEDSDKGLLWEAAYLSAVAAKNFSHITVARFSSLTLEKELEENTNSVIPYFTLNIGVMIAFCVITCMMTDWVKSKPLIGLLGVFSAILGTITAFGFTIYLGIEFIGINLAVPFLMLGIGIDDTFVMLGAWRRTSPRDSVPDRLGECFKDAAVSITITSLTDMLSFWIGVITPFPCVQIFCIYTGFAVAFTYFWHITFFGACLAIAGHAESQNRHAVTCMPVRAKSVAMKEDSFLYRVFCAGGIDERDPLNPIDNKENGAMIFFRDYIAAFLNKSWAKVLVIVLFLLYLASALWGCTGLSEGLERKRLARYDSYSVLFYYLEDTYFRELPYRVNVVISGALNYSDPLVQNDMEQLLRDFEATPYIDRTYTESWLRDFLDFVERNRDYSDIDISDELKFISTLEETYLSAGPTHYEDDVKFAQTNGTNTQIIGARFLIQGAKIRDTNEEKDFVESLRAVCRASKYNVTVYHPYFVYFDQFLLVLPTTIQCVAVAAIVMMFVSIIFIPHPLCAFYVAFSIISIELGVVGYMTLWDVSLDSISMINLIMCIGFSVDFSAHISYHFMSRHADMTTSERVSDSLFALGLPITQGAVSTVIGVLGLILAPSYIFITFFKMVFLVILLGALHGIFVLPVLLSICGPGSKCVCAASAASDTNRDEEEDARRHSTSSSSSSAASKLRNGDVVKMPQLKQHHHHHNRQHHHHHHHHMHHHYPHHQHQHPHQHHYPNGSYQNHAYVITTPPAPSKSSKGRS